jgi:hypothetical protein
MLAKVKPGELAKRLQLRAPDAGKRFRAQWLPAVAREALSPDWYDKADPDTARLLQESAYSYYIAHVAEGDATDTAGTVYEEAALWVAREHPILNAR